MRILSIDGGIRNCALVDLSLTCENDIRLHNVYLLDFNKKKKDIPKEEKEENKKGGKKDNKKKAKEPKIKFNDLVKNIINELDQLNLCGIEKVIIENPPSMKNPILKSVSMVLYVYFTMKDKPTEFISPSRKLTKQQNKELSYKERKAESVKKVLETIGQLNLKLLEGYTRLHDICDCINQAIAYICK